MLAKSISGAAAAVQPAFIEDVFSTYLYTGNGSTQTITNGIDLAGKGGLVWIKSRSQAGTQYTHGFWDTLRGPGFGMFQTQNKALDSSSTAQEGAGGLVAGETDYLSQFRSNGFVLTPANNYMGRTSNSGITYASWTFREQAKFFDIVTYTGNGANRTIAHNLGSVPGCIIIKRTDTTSNWAVYHRSTGNTQYLQLNTTVASATDATWWNNTTPSATTFTLGTDTTVNANGGTYVAYLFAHNAGGFGLTGTDNVISCGSYTGTGAAGNTINLGYEPQWVMVKRTDAAGNNWAMLDIMRGMVVSGSDNQIFANDSGGESPVTAAAPTSTGFVLEGVSGNFNASGAHYIYIAIRRGPMKVPTSGTSVYNAQTPTPTGVDNRKYTGVGFPLDAIFLTHRTGGGFGTWIEDRLRGAKKPLYSYATTAEDGFGQGSTQGPASFDQDGWTGGSGDSGQWDYNVGYTNVFHYFRRAPGFFDVVAYTGTGANRTVNHNLAAVPELMIVKSRGVNSWRVYSSGTGNQNVLELQTTGASAASATTFNNTSPTASVFTVGTNNASNASGGTYIAYLFASCPGVSKVGSYTGTGTTKQIDCGFTGGARFVLIKRTDSTGDWYVWDTARGIVAGNDPYLLLNSAAAEVTSTDYIDTYSAGFEISSTAPAAINANGGTFIFLAIA